MNRRCLTAGDLKRLLSQKGESMTRSQLENDGPRGLECALSAANGRDAKAVPFAERLSCTVDEACEATGLGRTKLYELIGSGQLIATRVGRRRLVMVQSILALLSTNASA
ncbi:excisionase family DNA-binding protein [Bradyrhizobium sp. SZCCHNR1021]|uniref:excisionase family DNA-binding protein n=2 Tax=Bradyrhizobium TaxID=374 RepID=UPI003966E46E